MDVIDCIYSRRSIRRYMDVPVEFEKAARIADAGLQAPTAGNIQDFRVIIVTDRAKRDALAEASLQQYWMTQAPVHLVVCIDWKKAKHMYGVRGERMYSLHHAGACIMNMLLTAHALDLGACWVGGFDEEMVKRACGIGDIARPQAIITIGYPDEKPPRPAKFLTENLVFIESWQNKIKDVNVVLNEYSPLVAEGAKAAGEALHKSGQSLREKVHHHVKKLFKK